MKPQLEEATTVTEAQSRIESAMDEMESSLEEGLEDSYDSVIQAQLNEVNQREGFQLADDLLGSAIDNIKQNVMRRTELGDAISGLRSTIRNDINSELSTAMQEPTVDISEVTDNLVEEMNRVVGDMTTIVMTEMHHASGEARTRAYREAEENLDQEFNYTWVGPDDARSTEICQRIKERVPEEGVSLDELRNIINAEAMDGFEFPTPHFNCRHQHIRKV